ncbi:hypothetical protein ATO46_19090 [Aeromonas schubertii]|uniref:FUSC family protein n=1 Tax=Aeromonas schubertii TaxID=652 RepID=UPI00067E7A0F|nr:FUSC family protein [Aeromonas schubertii]KUE79255.1 hypothetical protein ATO46_19090 [Aeromonas schubertii]
MAYNFALSSWLESIMVRHSPISLLQQRFYRHYRLIHGVRLAFAFMVTLSLIRLIKLPNDAWSLVTMVVILGPLPYWGNIVTRTWHRVLGTCVGAALGMVALYLLGSLPWLGMIWCAAVMVACGYVALGKRPYVGLLLGITLAVIVGPHPSSMEAALWRAGDVLVGALIAIVLAAIWPHKAYLHWRMKLASQLRATALLYRSALSPNLLAPPPLEGQRSRLMGELVKLRPLMAPAARESGAPLKGMEQIQRGLRNLVAQLELLGSAFWANRESHFTLLGDELLRRAHQRIGDLIDQLAQLAIDGQLSHDLLGELAQVEADLRGLLASGGRTPEVAGYLWLNLALIDQLRTLQRDLLGVLNHPGGAE